MQPTPPDPGRRQQMREAFLAAILEACERRARGERVPEPPPPPARDVALAAALLAISVARADHQKLADEHRAVERALRSCLGLTEDEVAMLYRRAEETLGGGGPGLAEIAATLTSSMPVAQKKDVVVGLWRVAYSDAELHVHEEYLVRKITHLFGLSNADLVETKLRAREEFLREDL